MTKWPAVCWARSIHCSLAAAGLSMCLGACVGALDIADGPPERRHITNTDANIVEPVAVTLNDADLAIAIGQWVSANVLLKQCLTAVSDLYTRPDTIDDSGMKLVLAYMEEQRGNIQGAVEVRRRVLDERFSHLRNRVEPTRRTH